MANLNQTPANQQPKPVEMLKRVMDAPSIQAQFKNALHENSGAFVASVIDLFNSDQNLQKCEPQRVVIEALKAATMKLPINKALGFAYIVPYGVVPTFIIGYKGLIQLALRTGQYRTINADVVYEGEVQKVNKLTGEISFDGEKTSDKVVGYFAYIEMINGFSKTLYMDLDKIAKHAKKNSATLKNNSRVTVDTLKALAGKEPTGIGWLGCFDDMALKTGLRQLLSKYGYLSVEMQTAISSDIESESIHEPEITPTKTIDIQDAQFTDVSHQDGTQQATTSEEDKPPYMQ
jgi:recombination protein RecT